MDIREIREKISEKTGVPVDLLTGATVEENVAQAKALLTLKGSPGGLKDLSAREKFAAWANGRMDEMEGRDRSEEQAAVFAELDKLASEEAGKYPDLKDGGDHGESGDNLSKMPDSRPTREKFADWAGDQMAYNPFKG